MATWTIVRNYNGSAYHLWLHEPFPDAIDRFRFDLGDLDMVRELTAQPIDTDLFITLYQIFEDVLTALTGSLQ